MRVIKRQGTFLPGKSCYVYFLRVHKVTAVVVIIIIIITVVVIIIISLNIK